MRLALNTIDNARKSLARLTRMYANDELEAVKYRTLVYGLSHLLAFDKEINNQQLEERLAALEEAMKL